MYLMRTKQLNIIFKLFAVILIQVFFVMDIAWARGSRVPFYSKQQIANTNTLAPTLSIGRQQVKGIISTYSRVSPQSLSLNLPGYLGKDFTKMSIEEIGLKAQQLQTVSPQEQALVKYHIPLLTKMLNIDQTQLAEILSEGKNVKIGDFDNFQVFNHQGILYIDKSFLFGSQKAIKDAEPIFSYVHEKDNILYLDKVFLERKLSAAFEKKSIIESHDAWLEMVNDPASLSDFLFYFTHESYVDDKYFSFNRTWALIGIAKIMSSFRDQISYGKARQVLGVLLYILKNENEFPYFKDNPVLKAHLINTIGTIINIYFLSFFDHRSFKEDLAYLLEDSKVLRQIAAAISSYSQNLSENKPSRASELIFKQLEDGGDIDYFEKNPVLKKHVTDTIATIINIYRLSQVAAITDLFQESRSRDDKATESNAMAQMWEDILSGKSQLGTNQMPDVIRNIIAHWSVHGLYSAKNTYLGEDEDTGGQHPAVLTTMQGLEILLGSAIEQILVARYVDSEKHPELVHDQEISESSSLKRIKFGPESNEYVKKGPLWKWLHHVRPAITELMKENKVGLNNIGQLFFNTHYGDVVSMVACQIAAEQNIPSTFRPHSDGVAKMKGMTTDVKNPLTRDNWDEKDAEINLSLRILDEFTILTDIMGHKKGQLPQVLVSTIMEKERIVRDYRANPDRITVVSLGLDYERYRRKPPTLLDEDELQRRQVLIEKITQGQEMRINGQVVKPKGLIEEKPIIATISRLEPKKNVFLALQAWAEDEQLREKYNFVIAAGNLLETDETKGEMKILRDCYEYIQENVLEGKVVIIGSLHPKDTPELYRIIRDGAKGQIAPMGALLNPAKYEPFGITIMEAMSTEIVAVATSNGGPVITLNDKPTINGKALANAACELPQKMKVDLGKGEVLTVRLEDNYKFYLNGQEVKELNGSPIGMYKGNLVIRLGEIISMTIDGTKIEALNAEPINTLEGELVLHLEDEPLFTLEKESYGVLIGDPDDPEQPITKELIQDALRKFGSLSALDYEHKGTRARKKIIERNSKDVEGKNTFPVMKKAKQEAFMRFLSEMEYKKDVVNFTRADVRKLTSILSELINYKELQEHLLIGHKTVDIINGIITSGDQACLLEFVSNLIDYDLIDEQSVYKLEELGVFVHADQSELMNMFLFAARVVKNILPQLITFKKTKDKKMSIGVTGESGAGKMAIASLLRHQLQGAGLNSADLGLDNYFELPPYRNAARRVTDIGQWVGPHEVKTNQFREDMAAFKNGDGFKSPIMVIDGVFLDKLYSIQMEKNHDALVVHGTYLSHEDIKDTLDCIIFVDIPYDHEKSIAYRTERDKLRGETTPDETLEKIHAIEHELIAPLRDNAHLVVKADGTVKPGFRYKELNLGSDCAAVDFFNWSQNVDILVGQAI